MAQSNTELLETREKVKDSIHKLIADVENLLTVGPEALSATVQHQRGRLTNQIGSIKAGVSDLEDRALDKYRQAAATTNAYLHGHPWKSLGVALLAGAVIAVLVSRRGSE